MLSDMVPETMKDIVLYSVQMFKDPSKDVRRAAVTIFGELAQHGQRLGQKNWEVVDVLL
jgi:hypothetical protein